MWPNKGTPHRCKAAVGARWLCTVCGQHALLLCIPSARRYTCMASGVWSQMRRICEKSKVLRKWLNELLVAYKLFFFIFYFFQKAVQMVVAPVIEEPLKEECIKQNKKKQLFLRPTVTVSADHCASPNLGSGPWRPRSHPLPFSHHCPVTAKDEKNYTPFCSSMQWFPLNLCQEECALETSPIFQFNYLLFSSSVALGGRNLPGNGTAAVANCSPISSGWRG